ncbi:hypothetical protein CH333_01570 [candidate division WOR-3 bacterium JGI_Cruoil_03_44_89]|uniref:Dihydropyrimidine dehydrogenase n=1 Tax=candidate division WOR-3 bacterium JGI_Cruoil_03_44_89 TaxID=1973748 RepID=A0A235C0B5_UNCW3|nr:MAG: hypothetical protein CH333_01570 [candidate division WOR-3 bacterium JGI_Cruoil_03_44_89]
MKLSFKETKPVMTQTQAVLEASRCLLCEDAPCNKGCPAGIDVKKFIRAIKFENFRHSMDLIKENNILPGVCGIVCPREVLCEKECSNTELSTPIKIGDLQRFVAEKEYTAKHKLSPTIKKNKTKVVVIGSGPAGLSCAAELATRGFEVTIFERRERLGGVLTYGIPAYRLPKRVVKQEINYIKKLGVKARKGTVVDSLDDVLNSGFRAVFIGVGLGKPMFCGIPGEKLKGVVEGVKFLEEVNENPKKVVIGERVIVIGGGSVAMDCACSALRVGARHVDLVCLEAPNELPAFREEIERAQNEGINIHTRFMPLRIIGKDGKVAGLKAIKIDWKIPGRFLPDNAVKIKGSNLTLVGDAVIEAIGQAPEPSLLFKGLKTRRGYLVVNKDMMTSKKGVFAGGDIIISKEERTVVQSVAEGKKAGEAIAAYLKNSSKFK